MAGGYTKKQSRQMMYGIGVGVAIGLALSLITGMWFWLAIGAGVGVVFGVSFSSAADGKPAESDGTPGAGPSPDGPA